MKQFKEMAKDCGFFLTEGRIKSTETQLLTNNLGRKPGQAIVDDSGKDIKNTRILSISRGAIKFSENIGHKFEISEYNRMNDTSTVLSLTADELKHIK